MNGFLTFLASAAIFVATLAPSPAPSPSATPAIADNTDPRVLQLAGGCLPDKSKCWRLTAYDVEWLHAHDGTQLDTGMPTPVPTPHCREVGKLSDGTVLLRCTGTN